MKEVKYTILNCVFVRTFVITFYYGSGSNFLTSYGSGSTRQKVTIPTLPIHNTDTHRCARLATGGRKSISTTLINALLLKAIDLYPPLTTLRLHSVSFSL